MTRTDTLSPSTTLFRSRSRRAADQQVHQILGSASGMDGGPTARRHSSPHRRAGGARGSAPQIVQFHPRPLVRTAFWRRGLHQSAEIGRANVCTPVTNAHIVSRLLHEKKTHRKKNK